ncbi:zinc ribbon domain-containing protein YjdM [Bradyrhizobium agreste]|uniref:zinc ribbon domain-containing protein YjdM n=1 Tax=Bradyrhizobium agreste TaxID=2751811 RepID=UPI0024C0B822|nr:zinc ribbon domain-containing protein YjdM [Bradyrhizobium agreste]
MQLNARRRQKASFGDIAPAGNAWPAPFAAFPCFPASARDANGNVLADGDSVIVIKDLKIKGSSSVVKGGTKVRNIRLQDASDGHNIACKIDGIGAMNLKSEFVKKA